MFNITSGLHTAWSLLFEFKLSAQEANLIIALSCEPIVFFENLSIKEARTINCKLFYG